MPRRDAQHSVVQPHPLLLPPAALLRLRRGHGHGGSPAADAAAPRHALLRLARNDRHRPFVVAPVDAEERDGRLHGRRRIDRLLAALPRTQPGGARDCDGLLGAALPAAGVARVLCRDARAGRAAPADGSAGRPGRATGAPVPALVDRLDVGHGPSPWFWIKNTGLFWPLLLLALLSPLT